MATVVTVMNMKGGVGKTTLCAHVAGMLSYGIYDGRYRRVLAIDYDPQFNLSQMFIPSKRYFALEKAGNTCLAILKDDETQVNPFAIQVPGNLAPPSPDRLVYSIHSSNNKALHIIPSTLDLMYVALGQTQVRTDAFEERFSTFIEECRKRYDVILIDCHPAGSILTKTSLGNSDHVIVPVVPSQFARRGVALMRQFIDSARKGPQKVPYHVVFNDNGTRASGDDEAKIRSDPYFAQNCLTQRLRKFKAFTDPNEGQGFVWSSGRPHSTRAFGNLDDVVTEIVDRLDL